MPELQIRDPDTGEIKTGEDTPENRQEAASLGWEIVEPGSELMSQPAQAPAQPAYQQAGMFGGSPEPQPSAPPSGSSMSPYEALRRNLEEGGTWGLRGEVAAAGDWMEDRAADLLADPKGKAIGPMQTRGLQGRRATYDELVQSRDRELDEANEQYPVLSVLADLAGGMTTTAGVSNIGKAPTIGKKLLQLGKEGFVLSGIEGATRARGGAAERATGAGIGAAAGGILAPVAHLALSKPVLRAIAVGGAAMAGSDEVPYLEDYDGLQTLVAGLAGLTAASPKRIMNVIAGFKGWGKPEAERAIIKKVLALTPEGKAIRKGILTAQDDALKIEQDIVAMMDNLQVQHDVVSNVAGQKLKPTAIAKSMDADMEKTFKSFLPEDIQRVLDEYPNGVPEDAPADVIEKLKGFNFGQANLAALDVVQKQNAAAAQEGERILETVRKMMDAQTGAELPKDKMVTHAMEGVQNAVKMLQSRTSPGNADKALLYEAIDGLKQAVGKRAKALERVRANKYGANKGMEESRLVYQDLMQSLESPDYWGETMAARQRKLNKEGWVQFIDPYADLKKTLLTERGAGKSINTWDDAQRADTEAVGAFLDKYKTSEGAQRAKVKEDVFNKGVSGIASLDTALAEELGHVALSPGQAEKATKAAGLSRELAGKLKSRLEEAKKIKELEGMQSVMGEGSGLITPANLRKLDVATEIAQKKLAPIKKYISRDGAEPQKTREATTLEAKGARAISAGMPMSLAGYNAGEESGAPMSTSYETVRDIVATNPESLGRFGEELSQAAQEGDEALAAKHHDLTDSYAYRKMLRDLEESRSGESSTVDE